MRDNHYGPRFADVQKMFPDARKFHWSENAFNKAHSCWLVGIPTECGGGPGMFWKAVHVHEIADLLASPEAE